MLPPVAVVIFPNSPLPEADGINVEGRLVVGGLVLVDDGWNGRIELNISAACEAKSCALLKGLAPVLIPKMSSPSGSPISED